MDLLHRLSEVLFSSLPSPSSLTAHLFSLQTAFDISMIVAFFCVWPILVYRSSTARHLFAGFAGLVCSMLATSIILEYHQINRLMVSKQGSWDALCRVNMKPDMVTTCNNYSSYLQRGLYLHLYEHVSKILSEVVHYTLGRWLTDSFLQYATVGLILFTIYCHYRYEIARLNTQRPPAPYRDSPMHLFTFGPDPGAYLRHITMGGAGGPGRMPRPDRFLIPPLSPVTPDTPKVTLLEGEEGAEVTM